MPKRKAAIPQVASRKSARISALQNPQAAPVALVAPLAAARVPRRYGVPTLARRAQLGPHTPGIFDFPKIALELKIMIWHSCDPITKTCLYLSSPCIRNEISEAREWYAAAIPISLNTYLPPVHLKSLLLDWSIFGSDRDGETGERVWYWSYNCKKMCTKEAMEREEGEFEEWVGGVWERRQEREEMREERERERMQWEEDVVVARDAKVLAALQEKKDARDDDDSDSEVSSLDEREMQEIEDELEAEYPEPDADTDEEDQF